MTASGAPALGVLHEVVEAACLAPSMYNAQPWAWRADDGQLALYADRTRAVPTADPLGRNLVIGCGAALHHARVAAAAFGWSTEVSRLPDPEVPDLLATIAFRSAPVSPEQTRLLDALRRRRTDRRRFTSWAIPAERLHHLADLATASGVRGIAVTDPGARHQLEVLATQALGLQASDETAAEEMRAWLDRSDADGVPRTTVPRLLGTTASTRSRFGAGQLAQPGRELETADGMVVLCGPRDDAESWLRAGEGLSNLWLHVVDLGLSLVPLTQVVEVEETRRRLQDDVLGGLAMPYLLLRLGWHSAAEKPLAATPRRPLADVLR